MTAARTTLLVRDLMMECQIGIYPNEQGRGQRVRVSIEIDVDLPPPQADGIGEVLNYERFVTGAKKLGAAGHINGDSGLGDWPEGLARLRALGWRGA